MRPAAVSDDQEVRAPLPPAPQRLSYAAPWPRTYAAATDGGRRRRRPASVKTRASVPFRFVLFCFFRPHSLECVIKKNMTLITGSS